MPLIFSSMRNIYPQDAIWKPDISLQNGFTKMKELGSSFVNVKVGYRGTVTWQPFEIFESHCTVDTKYFPFDEQTCDILYLYVGAITTRK